MAMSWWAPSASAMSWRARSAHTSVTAAVEVVAVGRTPEAPEASSSTVSLVDWQPSESIRSKVVAVAARSTPSSVPGCHDGVRGDDDQHGGQGGREHAGALGHAADGPAVALDDRDLVDRVGGLDGDRRSLATVGVERTAAAATPARTLSMGSSSPISPVEQTTTSCGGDVEHLGDLLGRRVGVGETLGAGAGVGSPGVEHHRVDATVERGLPRPGDRGRLDPVAREDRSRVVVGSVVDDEGEIRRTGGLETGRDA